MDSDVASTKPKLLIVEDDVEALGVLKELLSDALPCDLYTAEDGRRALEVVREEVPDVVLLDVHLPVQDGFSVLEQIQAEERLRQIRVLLMTGEARGLEDKIRGLNLGAYDYLIKPVDPHELIARLQVAFRLKQVEESLLRAQSRAAYLEGVVTTVRTLQHEINNPLQALLGSVELLERQIGDLPAPLQQRIGRIKEAIERIAGFTQQLGRVTHVQTVSSAVGEMIDVPGSTGHRRPSPSDQEEP